MLCATPVRNHAARESRSDGDQVVVEVPRRRPGWLVPPLSWVVRPPGTRRIALDRLGTQVWSFCDGRRTVENVIDAMADAQRLTFHEARVAVTGYLRMLGERGALVVVMPR